MDKVELSSVVKTWGKRLKNAGKTYDDAAKETGLYKSQISQYINGVNTPSITKFEKFENYLRGLGV